MSCFTTTICILCVKIVIIKTTSTHYKILGKYLVNGSCLCAIFEAAKKASEQMVTLSSFHSNNNSAADG